MKICFQIFLLFLIFSFYIYPQENKRDSVQRASPFDSLQKLQTKFEEFEIYRQLNYMKLNIPATGDSNTVWMWTRLAISNSSYTDSFPGEFASDMITPLSLQFRENSKLNPVRYILGMAQTAAAGYLLYRHIKKYGLFK
jgi:hypothetical protein